MSQKPKILVIGSANMDMVIKADHFPVPGETIIGGEFSLIPGGKGANQAVAAARLGGQVTFLSKLGTDVFGDTNLKNFQNEGINTSLIGQCPDHPSGVALITVDKSGENTIIVAPGANSQITVENINKASSSFDQAELILAQLEIPLDAVLSSIKTAREKGKRLILNPAPASPLTKEFLEGLYMITPNETESKLLTGIAVTDGPSAEASAAIFVEKGVQNVIITMGASGAFVYTKEYKGMVPTEKVKAIDTTAAGDTFNGALAVALAQGNTMENAVKFALKAATLSVQRMGAQSSIPRLEELS
jgi:ribokinase